MRRPIFKRRDTFIAIRPIDLGGGKIIKTGEEITGIRRLILRRWLRRRLIGPKDNPWTDAQISRVKSGKKTKNVVPDTEIKEVEETPKTVEKPTFEPIKIGSRWGFEEFPKERFTSKKKAVEWLDEQDEEILNALA